MKGKLVGGILLNRTEEFIDQVSALVYPASNTALAATLDDGLNRGIISLFLGDTRN
ncbi:hypothetical protein [Pseudogemmobacter bohemicus]|uniref:hypothetical protein n=1 Tax=Pseudogemmobacter bohemicus TaxID=2250708 RepID=UPI0013002D61|nr:hypothetical protein [Pseudogemmobacter bohemicus]